MDVIAHIKSLTEERGWSQYKLAHESGLPQTTIANIFTRGTIPSVVTLESLCNAFHITLSEFFMEEKDCDTILSTDQRQLLEYYMVLTPNQKDIIIELLKNMNA